MSVDIPRAQSTFRFCDSVMQFGSESHHWRENHQLTLRQPFGVVGCISPWNLPPTFSPGRSPALATGNCVVLSSMELTPMTAYLLLKGLY